MKQELIDQLRNDRLKEVCIHTVKGAQLKTIAQHMNLSVSQVKDSRKVIYKTFKVSKVAELQAKFGVFEGTKPQKAPMPRKETGNPFNLTDKQFDACKLAYQGKSLTESAQALGVNRITVRDRLQRSCVVTGTRNTQELIQVLFGEVTPKMREAVETLHPDHKTPLEKAADEINKLRKQVADFEKLGDVADQNKYLVDEVVPDLKKQLASVKKHDAKKQTYISKLETDLRKARSDLNKAAKGAYKAGQELGKEHVKDMKRIAELEQELITLKTSLENWERSEPAPTHCSLCQAALEKMS